MNDIKEGVGYITAMIFNVFSWQTIGERLAIILTAVMIIYYILKIYYNFKNHGK